MIVHALFCRQSVKNSKLQSRILNCSYAIVHLDIILIESSCMIVTKYKSVLTNVGVLQWRIRLESIEAAREVQLSKLWLMFCFGWEMGLPASFAWTFILESNWRQDNDFCIKFSHRMSLEHLKSQTYISLCYTLISLLCKCVHQEYIWSDYLLLSQNLIGWPPRP